MKIPSVASTKLSVRTFSQRNSPLVAAPFFKKSAVKATALFYFNGLCVAPARMRFAP